MAEEAGRLLYGNLLGPKNNRIARQRLQEARRHAGSVPGCPSAADLWRDGCGPYSGIDRAILDLVRREYFAAIQDPAMSHRTSAEGRQAAKDDEPVYRITVKDTSRALPSAIRLIDQPLQRFLMAYYGANFRLHSMVAWRIFHVPAEVLTGNSPYSLLWHVDGHPPDTLKLFVALDDIGDDQGPLHFVTKQRTGDLIRMGYRNRRRYGAAPLEDADHLRRLTGPAGTAAFCNTTTNLHRAGIPAPGHQRDILQFRLEASKAPFDPLERLPMLKAP